MRALINLVESWPKGAIDRRHQGLCGLVALALHRDLGWPLVGLYQPGVWEPGDGWRHRDGHYIPNHVAVVTPDGHYADFNGMHQSRDEFLGRWIEHGEIRPVPAEEVRRIFRLRPREQRAQAEEIAAELIRSLG